MKKCVILFFLSFVAGHINAQNEGLLNLTYDGQMYDYIASNGEKGTMTTKISISTFEDNRYLLNIRLYSVIDYVPEDSILLYFEEKSEIQSFLQKCLDLYETESTVKGFLYRDESLYTVVLVDDLIAITKRGESDYISAIPKLFFEKALKIIE